MSYTRRFHVLCTISAHLFSLLWSCCCLSGYYTFFWWVQDEWQNSSILICRFSKFHIPVPFPTMNIQWALFIHELGTHGFDSVMVLSLCLEGLKDLVALTGSAYWSYLGSVLRHEEIVHSLPTPHLGGFLLWKGTSGLPTDLFIYRNWYLNEQGVGWRFCNGLPVATEGPLFFSVLALIISIAF